jgi:hypothetical protein
MAHPGLAEEAIKAGAVEVQFIGCPPEDCVNREGNLWMERRLSRERLPKLHLAYVGEPIQTVWTAPNRFHAALRSMVKSAEASAYNLRLTTRDWRRLLPLVVLLAIVTTIQVAISHFPYHAYAADQALVEIMLDHQAGVPVAGAMNQLPAEPVAGGLVRLVLEINGQSVLERNYPISQPGEQVPILERVWVTPGEAQVRLLLFDRPGQDQPQIVYDQITEISAGEVLALHYWDLKTGGDEEEGERIFYGGTADARAGCAICHSLEPGITVVGPSLAGIASQAVERIPGLSAEEYLYQSIVDPNAYLVEGFEGGRMPSNYEEILTDGQIQDILAFLSTLK